MWSGCWIDSSHCKTTLVRFHQVCHTRLKLQVHHDVTRFHSLYCIRKCYLDSGFENPLFTAKHKMLIFQVVSNMFQGVSIMFQGVSNMFQGVGKCFKVSKCGNCGHVGHDGHDGQCRPIGHGWAWLRIHIEYLRFSQDQRLF